MFNLGEFVIESNKIEGIAGCKEHEIQAHHDFLNLPEITVADIENFVNIVAPDAVMRTTIGQDVRVANQIKPLGGPEIEMELEGLVGKINDLESASDAFIAHVLYETLHPFTDGNGRSGRVIWLWMMCETVGPPAKLGFLHTYYYQSLEMLCKADLI